MKYPTPTIVPARAFRGEPSRKINLAFIGTGNQGLNDIGGFLGDDRVQIVALCDVNKESPGYWDGGVAGREPAKRRIEDFYSKRDGKPFSGVATYVDYREMLASRDIDAVAVCTPDHWHGLMVVHAARAGKDIYCQKPLSLTIAEGRRMSDEVRKRKRVFQCGSQQRSDFNFRRACELVRNGRIGKLHTVRVGLPAGRSDYGRTANRKKPEPIPPGFEYDRWLGPAPDAPYAPARCHVNFRWIFDYSGGQVTDWGGHHPDCAQWGMGTESTGPVAIENAEGEFPPDELWNTASAFHFEAVYANGVRMIVSSEERGGVRWEGSDGWVWANRGTHNASSKDILNSTIGDKEIRLPVSDNHYRNFVDRILDRGECVAPVETAHRSITICHLGNIAMRLGRKSLKWDPRRERIIGDDEASKMLSRPMRGPYQF